MLGSILCRKFSSISRRAVYDIGSGSIKFQIADVDLKTNKIVTNHIQKAQQVLFVNEKRFTTSLQEKALEKLRGFHELSEEFGVMQSIGVATQAFRNSQNGRECLDFFQEQLNFPLRIVSKEEEASSRNSHDSSTLYHDCCYCCIICDICSNCDMHKFRP